MQFTGEPRPDNLTEAESRGQDCQHLAFGGDTAGTCLPSAFHQAERGDPHERSSQQCGTKKKQDRL
jgi:hypothetical protein